MNRRGLIASGIVVLLMSLAVLAGAQTRKLTILHTNDTHSAMVPFDASCAGIARMATLIKTLKAAGGNVLTLNAGDVFVGSFEFNESLGYPELKIMENLYDAMELGNHEFDLGVDTLAGVLSGRVAGASAVRLPILCANVDFAGTPLDGLVQACIIKKIGDVTVGIFGLVTQEPQHFSKDVVKRFRHPYEAADPEATLWHYAAALADGLKAKCDVVVCLSHLGAALDNVLADNVPNIDVIVGGHSHSVFQKAVERNGKIIVQAGHFGEYLGELRLRVTGGAVMLESWKLHAVDGRIKEDPQVKARVDKVRSDVVGDPRFGPVYGRQIAVALRDITKSWPARGRDRDTPLGNLVTDAFRNGLAKAGFQADCALDVLGYLGADIRAGKVVGNHILRAVPYGYDQDSGLGFKVVVVPLTGSLLLGGLEYAADMVTLTTDLAVQTSGLTYAYDSSKPAAAALGKLSRLDPSSVMVNGESVAANLNKVYKVAMSDKVFGFFNDVAGGGLTAVPTGLPRYTVVRDYMESLKLIQYKSEGRIKDTAPVSAQ